MKGKAEPLTIYQPIAAIETVAPEQSADVRRYEEGLQLYRARKFAEASAAISPAF